MKKFLLSAIVALLGMSAFAQAPENGAEGYLYNADAKVFISGDIEGADGKMHATTGTTGIKYKVIIDGGKWRFETESMTSIDSNHTLGDACRLSRCETNSEDRITTTQYWGWSKWDLKAEEGKGFRIVNQYGGTSTNFAKGTTCISIAEDGTLTLVPEADAPYWQFVDQATYDELSILLNLNTNAPENGAVGYLFNPDTKTFISGDVEGADGKQHATTGTTGIKYKVIIDGGKWRFETESMTSIDSNHTLGDACRLSRCETNSEDRITTTQYWGWSKWDLKAEEGKGFRIVNQYGGTSTNFAKGTTCISIAEDGTLTLLPEADAPYWVFVDEETYAKLVPTPEFTKPTPKASPLATDGETIQYLFNVGAKAFFVGANDYGTRASFDPNHGYQFKVKDNGDGTFTLNNMVESKNNTWQQVFVDWSNQAYVDNTSDANRFQWVIEIAEDGTFKISHPKVEGYLGVVPTNNDTKLQFTTAEDAQVAWIAVSEEDYEAWQESFSEVPEYTNANSFADVEGKIFRIQKDEEGKALCFLENQVLNFEPFDQAFVAKGCLFKIEAAQGDDVTGYYYIRTLTPTGGEYTSPWGGSYLNSQPADGDVSFVLGLNNQNGQDIKNGAVWDIQFVEGKGFTLKNIGTGKYLNENAPAKFDDPAYWTFAYEEKYFIPVGKTAFAEYKAALAAAKAVDLTQVPEVAKDGLLSALDTYAYANVINKAATVASVQEATDALNEAVAVALTPVPVVVTFDFNKSSHAVSSNDSNAGDITEIETLTEEGVTLAISPAAEGKTTPNRYWGTNNGPQLRMYSGYMELTAPEGKAIVEIEINNGKWNAGNKFNGVESAAGAWAGNCTKVAIDIAGNTQMNSIVVTLADADEATTDIPTAISFANTKKAANVIFNVAGQQMKNLQKGLNIVGGKKVYVK